MKWKLLLIFTLFSIKSMAQFSQNEIDIIRGGAVNEPFRVLLSTNETDVSVLRTKCEDVDLVENNEDLSFLIERLLVTMEVEQGVGIAAPQVGISKNIFLFVRVDKENYPVEVVINPRIVGFPDEFICFKGDGCLSVPNRSADTNRYPWIDVEYTNIRGELVSERLEGYSREGNFAGVIFQHEFDHLRGVLFIDKVCIDKE